MCSSMHHEYTHVRTHTLGTCAIITCIRIYTTATRIHDDERIIIQRDDDQ